MWLRKKKKEKVVDPVSNLSSGIFTQASSCTVGRSILCPGEDFEPFPWTTSQPCPSWIKGRRVLIIRLQFHVGFILDWERDSHLNFNGHGM